ncbi:hypothetical protein ACEWY4_001614 [Coilia grayii]|uniref:Fibrinogen C-terminal domain-containing protein n=1 Tax=Coilia grayii TaxID=363190 RepID=A0ABD1KTF5_9TELE
MRPLGLCVGAMLLLLLLLVCGAKGEVASSCPVKLKAVGGCAGGEEECPFQLTLPPLSLQLPRSFRTLERSLRELQSLREEVAHLRTLKEEVAQLRTLKEEVGHLRGCCGGGTGGPRLPGEKKEEEEEAQQDQPGGDTPGTGQSAGPNPRLQEVQQELSGVTMGLQNATAKIAALEERLSQLQPNTSTDRSCSNYCAAHAPAPLTMAVRDCSDYSVMGRRTDGVYQVTPDLRGAAVKVWCDMASLGGGWTVIQRRVNDSVSFNRSWDEYKRGFGDLGGNLWLGNELIHSLTRGREMVLRVELQDAEGRREYAKYDHFYVANERLRYKLSVSDYSGTAGDALHFGERFNHDQKFFSTPDSDNDMYAAGNCAAYYGAGWWFDACMSANLNGRYYRRNYRGVRNGIFWGTWPNATHEFYPTGFRQAFRAAKMMIRPKNYAP